MSVTAHTAVILAIQSEKAGPEDISQAIRKYRKGVGKDVASKSTIETEAKNSDCVRSCNVTRRQASGFS